MTFLPQQGLTLKSLLENPDLLNPPKQPANNGSPGKEGKKAEETDSAFNGLSAFLGPNLWEKTLPYDGLGDMKLEYMDLDEFLNENTLTAGSNASSPQMPGSPGLGSQSPPRLNIPSSTVSDISQSLVLDVVQQQQQQHSPTATMPSPGPSMSRSPTHIASPGSPVNGEVNVDFTVSHGDVVLSSVPGQETFDPRRRAFSEEELRPQPMIKKSKKVFVPEEQKDNKYWSRRQKNNVAAKRSRDARRIKENQIALRASYLEKENNQLKLELEKMRMENKELKNRITTLEKGAAE